MPVRMQGLSSTEKQDIQAQRVARSLQRRCKYLKQVTLLQQMVYLDEGSGQKEVRPKILLGNHFESLFLTLCDSRQRVLF